MSILLMVVSIAAVGLAFWCWYLVEARAELLDIAERMEGELERATALAIQSTVSAASFQRVAKEQEDYIRALHVQPSDSRYRQ